MNKLVVGIGEILWDILPGEKQLGGAPANFAYHASQLGVDGRTVSAIGNDDLGNAIVQTLDERSQGYALARVPYATGCATVNPNTESDERYSFTTDCAWDHLPFTSSLAEMAQRTAACCFGSLAQRNPTTRHAIARYIDAMPDDSLKIFDVNLRPPFIEPDVIRRSLYLCNILKLNTDELDTLVPLIGLPDGSDEAQCRRLMQRFDISYVVLTQGEEGSSIFAPDESSTLPASPVKVVDTVGAGDAFTATFAVGLLSGLPLTEAHLRASDISAYVCTQHGATPPHPREFSFEE